MKVIAMSTKLKLGSLLASGLLAGATLFMVAASARDSHAAVAADTSSTASFVAGDGYKLTTAVVGACKAGAECTATITLDTEGEHHVNKDYPFKFVPGAVDGVAFGASSMAKNGPLGEHGFRQGVMTVKFTPAKAGAVTIAGKFKICVCTDQTCAPSTVEVSIPVTVK
jgi:hypothetical protein